MCALHVSDLFALELECSDLYISFEKLHDKCHFSSIRGKT